MEWAGRWLMFLGGVFCESGGDGAIIVIVGKLLGFEVKERRI